MVLSNPSITKSSVTLRLYRSILKAAKPFTPSQSPDGVALSCLLHRTGHEDSWEEFLRTGDDDADVEDLSTGGYGAAGDNDDEKHNILFRKLVREVVAGNRSGVRQMQFPTHVLDRPTQLRDVIRREFRNDPEKNGRCVSLAYDSKTRQKVAFMALRELNTKLSWVDRLRGKAPVPHPQQAARGVAPLPLIPSTYLRPGTFLLAHPNITGYFRRTVLCILDHKSEEEHDNSSQSSTRQQQQKSTYEGTYGLIVNRVVPHGPLEDVLGQLPDDMQKAFGASPVKEGGPVNMSLQMIHTAAPEQDEMLEIGGTLLPEVELNSHDSNKDDGGDDTSAEVERAALHSDKAVYYNGGIVNASNAVISGKMDRDDVSFFVGASCWVAGQLESEVERGNWLPVRGPPEIAHSGLCRHNDFSLPSSHHSTDSREEGAAEPPPISDLWLSMMSSCGEEEKKLAHLVWSDKGDDECSEAADDFILR